MHTSTLLCAIFGSALLSAAPPPRTQADFDFALGSAVGECLAAKCQIFEGTVMESPVTGATSVRVHARESLYGPAVDGQAIAVPYVEASDYSPKDGVHELYQAWNGFAISRNAPVTVVRVLEPFMDIPAGNPVIVTADDHTISIIRALANDAKILAGDPMYILQLEESLSNPNPALAGCMETYLWLGTGRYTRDETAAFQMRLLQSSSLPPHYKARPAIAMASAYPVLSPVARSAMIHGLTNLVQRYIASGSDSDAPGALAAYAGLATIWSIDSSVKTLLDPSASVTLARGYVAGIRAGTFGRTQLVETELHVDPNLLRVAKQRQPSRIDKK